MSRYFSYLNSAKKIIESYQPGKPFVFHLKEFFSNHKQMGSRDRKTISNLCYDYYRCYFLVKSLPTEDAIVHAVFLCEHSSQPLLNHLEPELALHSTLPVSEKLKILDVSTENIFPYVHLLSKSINPLKFSLSLLTQPDLFLRIRPGKRKTVIEKIKAAGVEFVEEEKDCIRLPNGTKTDALVSLNKEVVIQDLNSQRVFESANLSSIHKPVKVWDCCAASGGKSILMHDILDGNMELTVSDIRKNILNNLKTRLQEAAVPVKKSFIADLSSKLVSDDKFDVIIADVPCTGSGTWSRTPEQVVSFSGKLLTKYVETQRAIALNAFAQLKIGGLFFYITCSVFSAENEEVIDFLIEKTHGKLLSSNYLSGYENKADSLFVSVMQKKS